MGGVVVIHHMPGYDAGHKEITRRLATFGCAALCPNLYSREAPGADPDDAAAAARARGGVPDDRLVGDVEGGINYLWSLPASNGKAATIGFCSGGRQSVLAACRLPVDAAVDCYGASSSVRRRRTSPFRSPRSTTCCPSCPAHCWAVRPRGRASFTCRRRRTGPPAHRVGKGP